MGRILIVDAKEEGRGRAAELLRARGHEVVGVGDVERVPADDGAGGFDVAVVDCDRDASSVAAVLRELRDRMPDTHVVLGGSGRTARALASWDAETDEAERLVAAVDEALASGTRAIGRGPLRPGGSPFAGIIGRSRALRELLDLVAKVAQTDSTVLITGETGTGKELIGRAIHQASRRAGRVFCAVNSAAVPETLLESELFGHRRGAFTGASTHKRGLFEHADRGTVFLDEVAEMPLSMQAKLLRFLQTGELRAVGSETPRYVDVRLVTATNKDLEREVQEGRFREDLFYRLAVIPVHVPPLRERREDVPLLAQHFLRRFAAKMEKDVEGLSDDAIERLLAYDWPGNVRQLENTIESGTALCRGRLLTAADLPLRPRPRAAAAVPESVPLQSLETLERTHILRTLEHVGWNRKRAAQILKISTTTLWRRLKEFGIDQHGAPLGRA